MTIRRLLTLITACILSGHAIADNSYGTNPAAIKMMQELAARDGYDADYLQALLLAVGRVQMTASPFGMPMQLLWHAPKHNTALIPPSSLPSSA